MRQLMTMSGEEEEEEEEGRWHGLWAGCQSAW
jgi:hypothetical protein